MTRTGVSGLSGILGTGAARTALPAAAALAGGYAVDGLAGAAGVGKDTTGNDLQIDEQADDANWNRMQILQKAESALGRGIEYGGSLLGLGNM